MTLTTQVVILITALIGLVKVARTNVRSPSTPDVRNPLAGLFTLLLSFGVFLFIPAVMLAFMWIMKNVQSWNNEMYEADSPAHSTVSALATQWKVDDSPALAMVRAADAASNSRIRDSLLVVSARSAASVGAHREAVIAAQAIASSARRDSTLSSLVGGTLTVGRLPLATSIVERIASSRMKDSVSREVVGAIAVSMRKASKTDSGLPKPR